jgi:hypothetical protein
MASNGAKLIGNSTRALSRSSRFRALEISVICYDIGQMLLGVGPAAIANAPISNPTKNIVEIAKDAAAVLQSLATVGAVILGGDSPPFSQVFFGPGEVTLVSGEILPHPREFVASQQTG